MIQTTLAKHPTHLVFAGVAFKHQRPEPNPELAARMADKFGFIASTSGSATGVAAEVDKIARLRTALGDAPLAIASGVTPENVHEYAPHLSHILVATGVSESFHEFDYEKLYRLRSLCQ
jgi:predicted TIM-barrel enzyme